MEFSLDSLMTYISIKFKNVKHIFADEADFHRYFRSDDYNIHQNYQERGMDETSECFHDIISTYVDSDARILEVGCSMGRHLAYLHKQGYRNLYGIEINENAINALRVEYPSLYRDCNVFVAPVETQLPKFDDEFFDVTLSATVLQHIHDGKRTMDEMARTTRNIIITLELEEPDQNYWNYKYRSYKREFEKRGFTQIQAWNHVNAPIAEHLKDKPHQLRVFERR